MKKLLILFLLAPILAIGGISLVWDFPAEDEEFISSFKLYHWGRPDAAAAIVVTNTIVINKTNRLYDVTGIIEEGKAKWFTITAIGSNGLESDPSNIVLVYKPRQIQNMRVMISLTDPADETSP